jgi:hypothetical protein
MKKYRQQDLFCIGLFPFIASIPLVAATCTNVGSTFVGVTNVMVPIIALVNTVFFIMVCAWGVCLGGFITSWRRVKISRVGIITGELDWNVKYHKMVEVFDFFSKSKDYELTVKQWTEKYEKLTLEFNETRRLLDSRETQVKVVYDSVSQEKINKIIEEWTKKYNKMVEEYEVKIKTIKETTTKVVHVDANYNKMVTEYENKIKNYEEKINKMKQELTFQIKAELETELKLQLEQDIKLKYETELKENRTIETTEVTKQITEEWTTRYETVVQEYEKKIKLVVDKQFNDPKVVPQLMESTWVIKLKEDYELRIKKIVDEWTIKHKKTIDDYELKIKKIVEEWTIKHKKTIEEYELKIKKLSEVKPEPPKPTHVEPTPAQVQTIKDQVRVDWEEKIRKINEEWTIKYNLVVQEKETRIKTINEEWTVKHQKSIDEHELRIKKIIEEWTIKNQKTVDDYEARIVVIGKEWTTKYDKKIEEYELRIKKIIEEYELKIKKIIEEWTLKCTKVVEEWTIKHTKTVQDYEATIASLKDQMREIRIALIASKIKFGYLWKRYAACKITLMWLRRLVRKFRPAPLFPPNRAKTAEEEDKVMAKLGYFTFSIVTGGGFVDPKVKLDQVTLLVQKSSNWLAFKEAFCDLCKYKFRNRVIVLKLAFVDPEITSTLMFELNFEKFFADPKQIKNTIQRLWSEHSAKMKLKKK